MPYEIEGSSSLLMLPWYDVKLSYILGTEEVKDLPLFLQVPSSSLFFLLRKGLNWSLAHAKYELAQCSGLNESDPIQSYV